MQWFKKSNFRDKEIVFFLIDSELVFFENEHHDLVLERHYGVPDSIAHIVKFAFPRGRIAMFADSPITYIEVSKQLNTREYRYEIARHLDRIQQTSWGVEEHYFVMSQAQIAEKLKEIIRFNYLTIDDVLNCSFVQKYLPETVQILERSNQLQPA